MSESPKGTEICDVISGKRYLSIARSYANLNNDSRHVVIMPKKRPGGGEGDFAYEGVTDARRLA